MAQLDPLRAPPYNDPTKLTRRQGFGVLRPILKGAYVSLSYRVTVATFVTFAALILIFGVGAPEVLAEKIWILKFTHEHPKRIQLDEDTGDFKSYWYMTYTLVNEDDEDHKFLLDIVAESDKGFAYHDGYHPRVASLIARRSRLEPEELRTSREVSLALPREASVKKEADPETASPQYDDLSPTVKRSKPNEYAADLRVPRQINLPVLKAGETWRCVAVFDRWDNEFDHLTVRVAGLTNDVVITSERPHERSVTERVLELRYERPGDEFWTPDDLLTFLDRKWVDVIRTIKTDLR